MPLALTSTVVFLTGTFLNSAQTVIYATVSIRSASDSRAGAVGWTSGMGRCGAVFGPWPGVRLLSAGKGDRSFTAFAPAGVSSMVFIGLAAVRGSRRTAEDGGGRHGSARLDAHWQDPDVRLNPYALVGSSRRLAYCLRHMPGS